MTRSISTLGDVTGSYDVILCDVWACCTTASMPFRLPAKR